MRRLTVVYASERPSCYVAVNGADTNALFGGTGARSTHFCRVLRLDRLPDDDSSTVPLPGVFVGWIGDLALSSGTLEIAPAFAACIGLAEGETVSAMAPPGETPVATQVMVQPHSVDDWEVVELQANYIEEHLLAQVAVLTPGMVFPVWIHGQMPVKLRVDPKDSNRGACFLLGRDSELAIESKQRRGLAARPVTVFGGSGVSAERPERSWRLRVAALHTSSGAPRGRLHPEDFEQLAGYAGAGSCLVWLALLRSPGSPSAPQQAAMSASAEGAAAGITSDAAGGTSSQLELPRPVLLRMEFGADVPRRQVVLGACAAEQAQVPCFGLVRVWRCRQVPVYVPRLELQPLGPPGPWLKALEEELAGVSASAPAQGSRRSFLDGPEASWLRRLFEAFVRRTGEVDLMDEAVLQLAAAGEGSQEDGGAQRSSPEEGRARLPPAVPSSSSEATDLYEGLSDIDDIYRRDAAPPCEVTSADFGIYEVDLGLDDVLLGSSAASSSLRPLGLPDSGIDETPHAADARPDQVTVRVSFALGAVRRADLRQAQAPGKEAPPPPFVRVSARGLAEDVEVTVAASSAQAVGGAGALNVEQQLTSLWAAVPGLREGPPEEVALAEVLSLVPRREGESEEASPLDGLRLFAEPRRALRQHILAQLGCQSEASAASVPFEPTVPSWGVPGAVAVTGAAGSGKTTLCRGVLAGFAGQGILPLEVSCARLGQPGRKFKAVQDWLHDILRFACWYSPAVVLLDDLGALCPDVEDGAPNLSITEERSVRLVELLLDLLPNARSAGARVALCATLPGDAAVHRTLWRIPALEHKVALRPPQLKERPEILQICCRSKAQEGGWEVDSTLLQEGALDEWGAHVDGFSVADLVRVVERACLEATAEACAGNEESDTKVSGITARGDKRGCLSLRHLERACKDFVPTSMADQTFFTSSVEWLDVGGLEGPKQGLLDMLTMPTRYAVLMDRAPVRTRKGVMLVGPPGCGKTMLVHAAASETKGLLRFLMVKGPELLSKYIGASEAGVRQVFERAAAAAPAAIFFDEIDALAPKRGADSTGVTDRVVNQMLCYLDGVEDRGRVYVVAATGRPDLVDPALMRPGRFDKIYYCGLPTDDEKVQICEVCARKHELTTTPAQLRSLVSKMPKLFTSADVNALFSSAKIEAVNEALQGSTASGAGPTDAAAAVPKKPIMTMAHVSKALGTAKASMSEADERRNARIFAAYREGARPNALKKDGTEAKAGGKVALA